MQICAKLKLWQCALTALRRREQAKFWPTLARRASEEILRPLTTNRQAAEATVPQ